MEQKPYQEFCRKHSHLRWRNLLDVVSVSHKSTRIAFSPDFLLNNRFAFTYQGFEAALQSQFVGKQYMTNAEVEALTLDKYFVSNLNLAYTFKPRKVVKEVTMGVTVYNLFNEEYENNGGHPVLTTRM